MAFGKWINNLKGLFEEGPMKELTEHVADQQKQEQEVKLSAENVVITDEFRQTFNVNSPVRENLRNSFLFSMLTMASYIVIADGKVEPEEYDFLGKFLNDTFGEEAKVEGMDVVKKLIAKHDELEAKKPMAFLQLIGDCGSQIASSLSEDLRYQMLSMLALIVKSDANISNKEVETLKEVAVYIGMKATDVDALMNLDIEKAKDEWQWMNE
ncbi:MAG: TerB family tellurite resistance protein [Prevotella sp.]|jgi:DnaJ like chaperone protein|nr:TerB family tellurite resistance protein [Prevotella sp.]